MARRRDRLVRLRAHQEPVQPDDGAGHRGTSADAGTGRDDTDHDAVDRDDGAGDGQHRGAVEPGPHPSGPARDEVQRQEGRHARPARDHGDHRHRGPRDRRRSDRPRGDRAAANATSPLRGRRAPTCPRRVDRSAGTPRRRGRATASSRDLDRVRVAARARARRGRRGPTVDGSRASPHRGDVRARPALRSRRRYRRGNTSTRSMPRSVRTSHAASAG